MKILRPSDEMNPYKIAERLAREEGKKCPCCGKSFGIRDNGRQKVKTIGINHRRDTTTRQFECDSCGAIWESEPYVIGERVIIPSRFIAGSVMINIINMVLTTVFIDAIVSMLFALLINFILVSIAYCKYFENDEMVVL